MEREKNALVADDRTNASASRTRHHALGHLFHTTRHRRAEHPLPDLLLPFSLSRALARCEDLVRLLEKVELEQLVGFIEDEMGGRGEGDGGGFEGEDEAEGGRDEDVCFEREIRIGERRRERGGKANAPIGPR